jgi:hypothetical protein
VAGLGVLVYSVNQTPRLNKITPVREHGPVTVTSAAGLTTPCYSANFAEELNVSRAANGCDTQLYNCTTFEASSEVYKIHAGQTKARTQSGFTILAKQALENDVKTNLKTFTITEQKETSFAGSPAYMVTAVDRTNNIAVIEAAVYHQSPTGDNIFILLHGNNGERSDLQLLEAQWQWK